ncbi:hypothetical protein IAT38_003332 [Cryptococcus sp. DSM 104549]
MSRPNAAPSRQGPAKPATASNPPANVPRRNPGTVPGLARTASSLRQSTPALRQSTPSTSLPAHLRNLSAPRIPSPLGKGTPARQLKQSLPARTSKTTERHVLLPEDPQLAPLPASPMGGPAALPPPPRRDAGKERYGVASSAVAYHIDERSDAEKMTKREREENKLPRLTAYATAEAYRLKLLQAFLKREHGVSVVRVYDDCVYAVYNLPLLPGYGATTKVRSSPVIKSPGGVSLAERMTMAEDLGYNDSYFPREDPSEVTPSEYILSNSPPSPINEASILATMGGLHHREGETDREREIEERQERLEVEDGAREGREGGGGLERLRGEDDVGVRAALEGEYRAEHAEPSSAASASASDPAQTHSTELGTHMSQDHPGYLEHIPSLALEPSDLPSPSETPASPDSATTITAQQLDQELDHPGHSAHPAHHQNEAQPSPDSGMTVPAPAQPRVRRRKSHSTLNNVAEAVFFSYGVSVFFGFNESEEREIMEDCESTGAWSRGLGEDDWEIEEFHYVYDPEAENPRIYNDMFTFKSRSHLFKLSLAHAIAQSNKLSIYESIMQETLAVTASFPKEMSTTGHLQLTRREALKMTGRLFKLRMDVNLIGGILDTPELFWSEASLFPLYEAIHEYLEIGPRVQVLNDRLAVAGDLLEIIHEYIEEQATHRLTWIVIWLIVVACFVEAGEVVARLVFHAIPRESGEYLLVKGPKLLLNAVGESVI